MEVLQKNDNLYQKIISEINVSDPLNLKFKLHDSGTIVQLGHDHYFEKMKIFTDIYPELLAQNQLMTSIDLRYHNKVSVMP